MNDDARGEIEICKGKVATFPYMMAVNFVDLLACAEDVFLDHPLLLR